LAARVGEPTCAAFSFMDARREGIFAEVVASGSCLSIIFQVSAPGVRGLFSCGRTGFERGQSAGDIARENKSQRSTSGFDSRFFQ
jgi:hypothetical protein